MPGIGHSREDLTDKPVKFSTVFLYLLIYDPASDPLEIMAVCTRANVERILNTHKFTDERTSSGTRARHVAGKRKTRDVNAAAEVGGRKALAGAAPPAALAAARSPSADRTVLRRPRRHARLSPERAVLNDVNPHLITSTAG